MAEEIPFASDAELEAAKKSRSKLEQEIQEKNLTEVGPPPNDDVLKFGFVHPEMGKPAFTFEYRDEAGKLLYVVARYEFKDEEGKQKKTFLPWSWHIKKNHWVCKAPRKPRPLYGLQKLPDMPGMPVLITEGEKKCDAAQKIVGGRYVALGWSGGASSVKSTDWTPLEGRKILIWPDNDEPGRQAALDATDVLKDICPEIKIIEVTKDITLEVGWDAADALQAGCDWAKMLSWAKPLIKKAWPIVADTAIPLPSEPDPALLAPEPDMSEIDPHGVTEEEQVSPSMFVTWERLGLSRMKNGNPHINLDNVFRFLSNETSFRNYLWFDEFHEQVFTQFDPVTHRPLAKPKLWSDNDELVLLNYLQRHVGLTKMNILTVSQGVALYAKQHVRNEPREWLQGLKWDGQRRLEGLLVKGFGSDNDIYSRTLSKNWIMSMVARIMRPGCQVDTMPVLFGKQGIKKSTSLEALASPWFAELSQKVDSLEFFRALRGKLLVEISEMASFKKSQTEEIKKMITTKQDHYRGMWGKHTEAHARVTIFVGTTNTSGFLNDETGARRFWPIETTIANPHWIRENRDQLFAEASYRYKVWEQTREDEHGWWMMPVLETERQHEKFRDFDEWENMIEQWAEDTMAMRQEFTITDCAKGAIGLPPNLIDRKNQLRISKVLTTLGWKKRSTTVEGKRCIVWFRGDRKVRHYEEEKKDGVKVDIEMNPAE